MSKPHITRSYGPIHFEDLDPHRFEDLVRQISYDFKNWQSIEATGRGGGDDGFDIRAREMFVTLTRDDSTEEDPIHPMDGNLWMIQCKREKEIGPKRIESIVRESITSDSMPYGFILAAPVNFSKKSHDKFRDELAKLGVMEFYLWGAGELEDMLHQPKNDHILFAFFGISLSSRKRMRSTEIRSTIFAKNKLYKLLSDNPIHAEVLVRNIQDTNYPYVSTQPKAIHDDWKPFHVIGYHPHGVIVEISRHYAYYDNDSRTYDYSEKINLVRPPRMNSFGGVDDFSEADNTRVKGFWEFLPHKNKVMFIRNGVIKFDSIALIDEKGDVLYRCPHLFVEFNNKRGPIAGTIEYIEINQHHTIMIADLAKKSIFPGDFKEPQFGTIHEEVISLQNPRAIGLVSRNEDRITLYFNDSRYDKYARNDVISLNVIDDSSKENAMIKITNTYHLFGRDVPADENGYSSQKHDIESQLGRNIDPNDDVFVIEAVKFRKWQIEQNRPVV